MKASHSFGVIFRCSCDSRIGRPVYTCGPPLAQPTEWVTKDEPMTGPQRSYLQTLCREAGEEFNENWTKAEASKKIEELQQKTGRGKSGTASS